MSALRIGFACALALMMSACAGSSPHMRPVPADRMVTGPEPGKALVFFVRPSGIAPAAKVAVYDGDEFIGIVPARKKVAYMAEPGDHRFSAIGEAADFLEADLAASRTYHVIVVPRTGWRCRFSLKPVHKDRIDSAEVRGWFESSQLIEGAASASHWASENQAANMRKRDAYLEKWHGSGGADRDSLRAEDGR